MNNMSVSKMSKDVHLPNQWKPRAYQKDFWNYWMRGGKRGVLCWHRRTGKDDVCLHGTAVQAHLRKGSYWHLLPKIKQARTVIWDAVNHHTGRTRVNDAFPKTICKHNQHEMKVEFRAGSNWSLEGSDCYDTLVGAGVVGLTFSEYALANPMAWSILQPMVEESGGYAIFISTPRGKNHFHALFNNKKKDKNWFVQKLTVDDTGVFSQAQLNEAYQEIYATYGDDTIADSIFEQEYYCSFDAAVLGAVYAKQLDKISQLGRISDEQDFYDKKLPVHTAWDLGRSDPTAIWFYQVVRDEIRFVDYFEQSHSDLPSLVKMLIQKSVDFGYRYALPHYLPHDGLHKLLAAGGRSIVEQLTAMGVECVGVPSTTKGNTVAAARHTIQTAWFGCRTSEAVEMLRSYRYEWDFSKRILSNNPVHDHTSHCADAFGIASRTWKVFDKVTVKKPPVTILDMAKAHRKSIDKRINYGQH